MKIVPVRPDQKPDPSVEPIDHQESSTRCTLGRMSGTRRTLGFRAPTRRTLG